MKNTTSRIAALLSLFASSFALHAQAVLPGRPGYDTRNVEVCGDLAVESGRVGSYDYISVWRRQPDGRWKILGDIRGDSAIPQAALNASPSPSPAAPPPPMPASAPDEALPIPDARPLSDGFVRTIQDDLKSSARRIRSAADPEKRRKVAKKAAKDLRTTIRDIGWIDVGRFGVPASCDAAYIVSQSDDVALMRATLPLMERDVNHSENDPSCYQKALEAYKAIAIR